MITGSVFIATSLDGFIARDDGGIDWLPQPAAPADGSAAEDYGYSEFMASIGALLMGRKTFDSVLGFDTWPYASKPVFVLSRTLTAVPIGFRNRVELLHGDPHQVFETLEARGFRQVYVDGGETIRGFLAAGLIRRLIITTIPILLGRGRPLFGALESEVPLVHVRARRFADGLVQNEYEVPGAGDGVP